MIDIEGFLSLYKYLKKQPHGRTYIYAEDYIKFVNNLAYYLNLKKIDTPAVDHYEDLKLVNYLNLPIG